MKRFWQRTGIGGLVLVALAAAALGDFLPEAVQLRLHARQIASGFVIASLVGPVTCLPLLYRLGALRVAELFQEHASLALQRRRAEFDRGRETARSLRADCP